MESCPGTPDSQGEPLVGSIAAPSTPGTPPPMTNNKCPVSIIHVYLYRNYLFLFKTNALIL